MKKSIILGLTATLAVVIFAGCGQSNSGNPVSASPQAVTEKDDYEEGYDASSVIANATQTQQAPAVESPTQQQAPIQQAPVQQAPVQQAPIQQAPVQQAPTQQAPIQQAPAVEAPTQQTPQIVEPVTPPAQQTPQLMAEISLEDAKAKALSMVPGATAANIVKAKSDYDDGRLEYEIEIVYGQTEYEFEIAGDGSIISWDSESIYD